MDRPVCERTAISPVAASQSGPDVYRTRVSAHGRSTAVSVPGARSLCADSRAVITAISRSHADRRSRQHRVSAFRYRGVVWLRDQESRIYRLCRGRQKGPLVLAYSAGRLASGVDRKPIDALSYATLFPDSEDRTRYASLGGRPSSRQMGLVQAAVIKLADGAELVAAFDADEAGGWLVGKIGEVVANVRREAERNNLGFRVHLPTTEGKDWNQVLQNSRTGSNSACQTSGR